MDYAIGRNLTVGLEKLHIYKSLVPLTDNIPPNPLHYASSVRDADGSPNIMVFIEKVMKLFATPDNVQLQRPYSMGI